MIYNNEKKKNKTLLIRHANMPINSTSELIYLDKEQISFSFNNCLHLFYISFALYLSIL
jgi:hypothetical protein